MTIGRDPSSDIILDPESPASRRHAEIYSDGGEWAIRDLGSRNGTLVNGAQLKDAPLNHHDEILVGENVFVFEYNDRCTAETAAAASRANPKEPLGLQNDPTLQTLVKSMVKRTTHMEREAACALGANATLVRDVFTAILAGGHCLLVGIPTSTKPTLLDALATMLDVKTGCLRMTPTTSRHEVTGTDILGLDDRKDASARLLAGPIFSQIFMAENINHASEKAQSAIFSAMSERRLQLAEQVWPMPNPFCVLATQENDAARDGSCPLTPAHLDQFILCPPASRESESAVPSSTFEPLVNAPELAALQALVCDFSVEDKWIELAVRIACSTRPAHRSAPSVVKRCVATGAGPKAALALLLSAKARAVLAGRLAITLDDLRATALPVLRHRITLNAKAEGEETNVERVIRRVFDHALATVE